MKTEKKPTAKVRPSDDPKNPFHHLKLLTTEKRDFTEEEKKAYSPWMINRMLSMLEAFVPIANLLNGYLFKGLSPDAHRAFLRAILPNRYLPFKYIKTRKEGRTDELLRAVTLYYGCGTRDAEEIMETLDEKQEENLLEFLAITEKQA